MTESPWFALGKMALASLLTVGVSTALAGALTAVALASARFGRALLARSAELSGALPMLVVLQGATPTSSLPEFLWLGFSIGFALGVRLGRAHLIELVPLLGSSEVLGARALGVRPAELARHYLWPRLKPHVVLHVALAPVILVGAAVALGLFAESDRGRSGLAAGLAPPPALSR
jgi:hypothetical protein